jgi:Fe-S cluster assembly ATP-binding protein
MLTIKNLSAVTGSRDLLNNVSLEVGPGEIHAVLGPKGSGKSSLAHVIAGHPAIYPSSGILQYNGKNLKKLDAEDRAKMGIYVSFQYTPEISGLTNLELAEICLTSKKTSQPIDQDYKILASMLELPSTHGGSLVNYDDNSDVDLRKNELLLMLLLEPKLIIIDEIDQGMSDDDISIVGAVLSSYANENNSIIIITHSRKLLDMVCPTHVHVMVDGELKEEGGPDFYKRIIEDGYSQFS